MSDPTNVPISPVRTRASQMALDERQRCHHWGHAIVVGWAAAAKLS